jgi:hypothetical protein
MPIGKMRTFAIAALAALGISSAASADIVYTNFQVVNNVNVHLTCSGYITGCTGYYGSGEFRFYNNGTLVAQTWCIDVTHGILGGSQNTFTVTLAQNVGGNLSNVWDGGAVGHGHQISWTMLGEIGGLMKYGMDNIADPLVSSAVQLAIWSLEYGSAISTDSDNNNVDAKAAALLADATTPGGLVGTYYNLAWLQHCDIHGHCNQGQLMLLVPEPGTLALFGCALLALLGMVGFARIRSNRLV